MRDPTVTTEAARLEDALGDARHRLELMIDWLPILRDQEYDPAAAFSSAVEFVARILSDPAADDLLKKHAPAPGARKRIIAALRQGRPPTRGRPGHRGEVLRDRWIADVVEDVRRLGFATTRSPATKYTSQRECAASIVERALREIVRARKGQGIKKLSEKRIATIWQKSTWGVRPRKRRP